MFKSPKDWRSFYVAIAIFLAAYAGLGRASAKKVDHINNIEIQWQLDMEKLATELP